MAEPITQKEKAERISSPEQLNDYLHVTTPAMWAVLIGVVLILVSLFLWSSVTAVESFTAGEGEVRDGVLTIHLDDGEDARQVEVGMDAKVGDLVAPVLSVGSDRDGNLIAVAKMDLPDGRYSASVGYRSTQIIEILFN